MTPISDAFWWLNRYFDGLAPSKVLLGNDRRNEILDKLDQTQGAEDTLRAYVHDHRRNARIDYGIQGNFLLFDRAYFYRNFLKCLVAAHYLGGCFPNLKSVDRVIDVGSGIGTFSVACQVMYTFPQAKYLLVDQHPLQIDLAKRLAEWLRFENFEFQVGDVFQEFHRRGFLIASYWLCGNHRESVLNQTEKRLRYILKDGAVIIDYRKNIEEFAAKILPFDPSVTQLEIRAPLTENVERYVGVRSLNVHMLVIDPLE
ncbi:MAG: methyltransferase domain-containing protein [Rhizomicrobium sp.]